MLVGEGGVRLLLSGVLSLRCFLCFRLLGSSGDGGSLCAAGGEEGEEEDERDLDDDVESLFLMSSSFLSGLPFLRAFFGGLLGVTSGEVDGIAIASAAGMAEGSLGFALGQSVWAGASKWDFHSFGTSFILVAVFSFSAGGSVLG